MASHMPFLADDIPLSYTLNPILFLNMNTESKMEVPLSPTPPPQV
jgi:hypothetical protein